MMNHSNLFPEGSGIGRASNVLDLRVTPRPNEIDYKSSEKSLVVTYQGSPFTGKPMIPMLEPLEQVVTVMGENAGFFIFNSKKPSDEAVPQ